MTWLKTTRDRRAARPFAPRVEALEDRTVPVANFRVIDNALFINAPTTPFGPALNRIVIEDNGTAGVNNIVASANGRTFRPNVPITNVQIRGGAGVEIITYNMTGSLVGGRIVDAFLGGSSDKFKMTVRRDFTAGASLNVTAFGAAGDDVLSTTLIGNMAQPSQLNFNANGGAGFDNLQFQTTSSVTIGNGSSVRLGLAGAGGSDVIRTEYNGTLNGSLAFTNAGGGARDAVRALVNVFGGSTGILEPSLVSGGGGDDRLRFAVFNNSNTAITFNQVADGNGGTDSCVRTNDVLQINCEFDNVI
jgi:hypothetical protein